MLATTNYLGVNVLRRYSSKPFLPFDPFDLGKIEVHSPHKLETHVLNRYFRHSKFASFQRQLNYFGFRKLAGKGKMAPCSYVNDATTDELGSLLLIKVRDTSQITLSSISPYYFPTSNNHFHTRIIMFLAKARERTKE